ncbi:Mitochondrial chaperone BCS1 [Apiospora arundinis]|uniref:Satratoxin biosynthesis SC1 cluster protein 4 n=1 Tax=Apiospora arundinis TaxID=335852 RepID=A0ABR2IAH1_9PEZI
MASCLIPITVLVGVACLAVGLRLYTRFGILRNAGLDEYFIGASLIVSLIWYFSHVCATLHGFGRPMDTIEPNARRMLLKAVWLGPAAWGLSSALCKLSIVWQYRRVFPTPGATRLCNYLMGILVVYGLFSLFGAVFRCWPVSSMWDLPLAGVSPESTARCMDLGIFHYVSSGVNIFMDLVIFALPVPLIRRLQISVRQKWALMLVFCFGGFVIIASVIRLIVIKQYVTATDPSKPVVLVALWSGIEINISITCACLATLRPLFSRLFPRLLPSAYSGKSSPSAATKSPGGSMKKTKQQQQQQQQQQEAQELAEEAKQIKRGMGDVRSSSDSQILMRLLQQQLAGEWGQKHHQDHAGECPQSSEYDARKRDVGDIV